MNALLKKIEKLEKENQTLKNKILLVESLDKKIWRLQNKSTGPMKYYEDHIHNIVKLESAGKHEKSFLFKQALLKSAITALACVLAQYGSHNPKLREAVKDMARSLATREMCAEFLSWNQSFFRSCAEALFVPLRPDDRTKWSLAVGWSMQYLWEEFRDIVNEPLRAIRINM